MVGVGVSRTGVPWKIIDYNGKLLSKTLSLESIIVANLDHEIDYIVMINDCFRNNTID